MTGHTHNILTLPLVLVVWGMEAYLFVALVRLALSHGARMRTNGFYASICTLADWLPALVDEWLSRRREHQSPTWLLWATAILGIGLARQLLLAVILSLSSPA